MKYLNILYFIQMRTDIVFFTALMNLKNSIFANSIWTFILHNCNIHAYRLNEDVYIIEEVN